MPLNNPGFALTLATGTYTGNDTANTPIAHGLARIPKSVLIICTTDKTYWFRIFNTADLYYLVTSVSGGGSSAVTAPDINNFYVGNASNYDRSANKNASGYLWFAI